MEIDLTKTQIQPIQPMLDYSMIDKPEKKESFRFEQQQQKLRAAINTMDLQNFLKDHHNYVQSSIMNECQNKSNIKFKKQYELSMEEEWECTKQDILKYFDVNNSHQILEDEIYHDQSLLDYPKFIGRQKLNDLTMNNNNNNIMDDTNINSTTLNQAHLMHHNRNNDKEEMEYE